MQYYVQYCKLLLCRVLQSRLRMERTTHNTTKHNNTVLLFDVRWMEHIGMRDVRCAQMYSVVLLCPLCMCLLRLFVASVKVFYSCSGDSFGWLVGAMCIIVTHYFTFTVWLSNRKHLRLQ